MTLSPPFVSSSLKPHPAAALFNQPYWIFTYRRRQARWTVYWQIFLPLENDTWGRYKITGLWTQTPSCWSLPLFFLFSLCMTLTLCLIVNSSAEGGSHPDPRDMGGDIWLDICLLIGEIVNTNNTDRVLHNRKIFMLILPIVTYSKPKS